MFNELENKLVEILEENSLRQKELLIKYPPDVPNEKGHHAFIKGISIENSFAPTVGEYNLLFETEHEKIYIWTHTKNKNSTIISDIDTSVKKKDFWKTAGSMMNLALSYYRAFEAVDFERKFEYKIIYYFSPLDSIESLEFLDVSNFDLHFLFNGEVLKATDIADVAQVIELMCRDDRCYTAISLLLSSFQIHYCCLICELGLSKYKKHESHEPELWEQADFITNMESAIVQACRCAESILGEPPNARKHSRILDHKRKWIDTVGINPDEIFERTELSYWEFYLRLFDELRNPSAHSYGDIHFDLQRKHTIDVQCFAALILRGYINKSVKSLEEAMNILKFDKNFLNRVQKNMSTKLTKNSYD